MDQSLELDSVKRKIRAMLAMKTENGASESEFLFAMKKVGELLLQYNLTMDEVLLRQEQCVTKAFNTKAKRRNVLWHVYAGLNKLLGVKVWYTRNYDGINWHFFGLEHDVDMAIYLCDFLQKAEKTSRAEFHATDLYRNGFDRRVMTNNFETGFGRRINERLIDLAILNAQEERKANEFHAKNATMVEASTEAQVKASVSTALMVVAKAKFVEEEFKKTGPKLRNTRSYSSARFSGVGYNAGTNAAGKVNLGRPVGGTVKPAGYLK